MSGVIGPEHHIALATAEIDEARNIIGSAAAILQTGLALAPQMTVGELGALEKWAREFAADVKTARRAARRAKMKDYPDGR